MGLGDNIRKRREQLGISQVELSKAIGISQAMLCQIERETKNPSLQIGVRIAEELDCNVGELFQKEEKVS